MKLITSILLSLVSFTLIAQNPTYEQTVEYIKKNTVGRMIYEGPLDSYKRATGHKLTNIVIEKNGRIELKTNQKHGIHDFDIVFNIFDLTSSLDYPDGIRAYKFIVHFKGLNVSKGFGITFATENDAIKVARAFRHLKTLCSQEDDLFGKPTVQEKSAMLTQEETITYIKEVLNSQNPIKTNDCPYNDCKGELKQTILNTNIEMLETVIRKEKLGKTYGYSTLYTCEQEKLSYYVNLKRTPFKTIKLYAPRTINTYSFFDDSNLYCLEFITEKKFSKQSDFREYSTGSRGNGSESKAINGCNNKSWRSGNKFTTSSLYIGVKTKKDAERLLKAFQHLNALVKEQKSNIVDPFGN